LGFRTVKKKEYKPLNPLKIKDRLSNWNTLPKALSIQKYKMTQEYMRSAYSIRLQLDRKQYKQSEIR